MKMWTAGTLFGRRRHGRHWSRMTDRRVNVRAFVSLDQRGSTASGQHGRHVRERAAVEA